MEVELMKGEGQLGDKNLHLCLKVSKKQLKVLQDAINYAAWRFDEGGAYPESSIKFLNSLHNKIEKQTGVKED